MSNAIYIASSDSLSGKSLVALGLMNMLSGKTKKIAYFKPVINDYENNSKDNHIETIAAHFGLTTAYEDMYAFTKDEVLRYRSEDNTAFVIDKIIAKFKKLEETHDFVLVEGSDFLGEGVSFEFDANIAIAKNLGIPVVLTLNAAGHDVEDIANSLLSSYQSFNAKEVQILSAVVNKVDPAITEELDKVLAKRLPKDILYSLIPLNKNLNNPTMKEITESVNGKILFGENALANQVDHEIVGAMQLRNCLTRLKENTLVVMPGDRADLIVAILQANISKNYPKVAGMILTGGLEPEEPIIKLIEGLQNVIPIVLVETGTFETVTLVGNTKSRIYADNKSKIELAINTFDKYIDTKAFEDKLVTFQPEGITPRMFQYQIVQRAKQNKKHIVLPEGEDDRILQAADMLLKQKDQ